MAWIERGGKKILRALEAVNSPFGYVLIMTAEGRAHEQRTADS